MDEDKKVEIMAVDAWNDLTREIIANAGDQAALTSLLTKATDAYSTLFVTHSQNVENMQKLEEQNDGLRKANFEYFNRIGIQAAEAARKDDKPGDEKSRAEKITFDDLFKKEE